MDNLQPGSQRAWLSEMYPDIREDFDEEDDAELDDETLQEMNDELKGKYDPPPTSRWPKE